MNEQLDLSSFCKTKAQAVDFLQRLQTITDHVYQTHFDFETELLNQFGIQKKDAFMKLLRDETVDVGTPASLNQFLTTLIEQVTKLPVLSLTLAFEPKEQTLKTLSQWFLLNTKKQYLFDITVDTSIVAGAAISVNGKYSNYSFQDLFKKTCLDILNNTPVKYVTAPTVSVSPATRQSIEQISLGR